MSWRRAKSSLSKRRAKASNRALDVSVPVLRELIQRLMPRSAHIFLPRTADLRLPVSQDGLWVSCAYELERGKRHGTPANFGWRGLRVSGVAPALRRPFFGPSVKATEKRDGRLQSSSRARDSLHRK